MINCENIFCIFQTNGKCTREQAEIDRFGMCMKCIHPNIDEEILDESKAKLLKKYEDRIRRLVR